MPSSKQIREPKSKLHEETKPTFPYCNATVTECGHYIVMDDRKDCETIRVQNGKSQTFFEMHPSGDYVTKIYGNGFEFDLQNKSISVDGHYTLNVEKDVSVRVGGDYYLEVAGDYVESIGGNITKLSKDSSKANMMTTQGSKTLTATEDIVLNVQSALGSGGKVIINGNLQVNGDIAATGISASGSIVAQLDVYAKAGLKTPGLLCVGTKYAALPAVPVPIPKVLIDALIHTETIATTFNVTAVGNATIMAGPLMNLLAVKINLN